MASSTPSANAADSHRLKHRKALENENTRLVLDALRIEWDRLSLVERGSRLRSLVEAGCTNRGLAADLKCSEGTIRRGLKIARLPDSKRRAIEHGANATPILKTAEDAARQRERDVLIKDQQTRDAAIAELEEMVHAFLDDAKVDSAGHRIQILDTVEHQIFDACTIYRPEPVRPKPVGMTFRTFLEACRPNISAAEIAETIPTQIIADQLTNALRYGANRAIVPEVLRRAMKHYEGQVSALTPRRQGK